MAINDPNDLKV